jgi:hypothetical protein
LIILGIFVFLLLIAVSWSVADSDITGVTRSFDFDRDKDVDGNDLASFTKISPLLHLASFASVFGKILAQDNEILTPKVMVINFNPILEAHGGMRLTEYKNWNDPDNLIEKYIMDIRAVSKGYVNYVIVDNQVVDGYPVKADGFQYTDETYLGCANGTQPCHDPDLADYIRILSDFDICTGVNNGDVDEVWLFGGPWFGYYESRLAGPDAFWYNSPPLHDTGCQKLLPIMGFNYERGSAEMLHSFGHRAESSITEVFGTWDVNQSRHDWDRYGHNVGQTTNVDFFQCGTVHFPPNGIEDYDYGNWGYVESNCNDWYNYPDFSGYTELINCEEWNCDHGFFMKWWLDHLPNKEGYHDGKLMNWWRYIVGNRYTEIYPKVIGVSSEYEPGWSELVLDGNWGTCNAFEWATAGQPTGWLEIQVRNNIQSVSIYDRACPEQVKSGHIELDNNEEFYFGPLEDSGSVATVISINRPNVEWIKVYIDTSTGGPNPGIGEIVFEYY